MRLTFLGTAAARPTVGRNVTSLVLQREGELLMFDCGEGTQRQMMRYGTGFAIDDIFFSHLHADHFLGVIGLLRTMGLQAREHAIRLYTPRGTEEILQAAVNLGVERVSFEVQILGLEPGESVPRGRVRDRSLPHHSRRPQPRLRRARARAAGAVRPGACTRARHPGRPTLGEAAPRRGGGGGWPHPRGVRGGGTSAARAARW